MESFKNVNASSYETLEWIVEHSDSGFFALIASEPMQSHVIQRFKRFNVAICDYRLYPGEYKFSTLEDWIADQPDKDAYFLLNFQRSLSGESAVKRLNFSRDMLARLNKNIIFCMTQDADNLLNREAYDLYSYIKIVVVFQDEEPDCVSANPKETSSGSFAVFK